MGTINAFIRRLLSSQRAIAALVRADVAKLRPPGAHLRDAKVTVVDLHNLHDRAKRFVVGVTIRRGVRREGSIGGPRGRCCSSCSTS